ncbi:MAG: FtsH-binding integral membrane protein [Acidimicrobiales bacterium]|jgi:FtsH-binding integral membrane protein
MSAPTETAVADAESVQVAAHDDHHPTEKQYWVVFAVLAAFTALEVAWSYMGLSGPALVLPLMTMMTIKFFLVAGIFMHLYFDFKALNGKYFTWAFAGAMILAIAVFFIVFAAFEFQISYFG